MSSLLQREVNDPRLSGLVTITEVSTSPDLGHARVSVSIMGTPEEKAEVLRTLGVASRFLRKELGERLVLRKTPELTFIQDESIERGVHLLDLIQKANKGEDD